jgi:hypothetical protein
MLSTLDLGIGYIHCLLLFIVVCLDAYRPNRLPAAMEMRFNDSMLQGQEPSWITRFPLTYAGDDTVSLPKSASFSRLPFIGLSGSRIMRLGYRIRRSI